MRLRDGDGVVHYEEQPWWPRCTYPRELPLNEQNNPAYFALCELTESPVTCIWCAAKRKRA